MALSQSPLSILFNESPSDQSDSFVALRRGNEKTRSKSFSVELREIKSRIFERKREDRPPPYKQQACSSIFAIKRHIFLNEHLIIKISYAFFEIKITIDGFKHSLFKRVIFPLRNDWCELHGVSYAPG